MNPARTWLLSGALLGGLGVALGAFGAHALAPRLDAHALDLWEKAVFYQDLHALAILICGALLRQAPLPGVGAAAAAFGIGVLLFSGSLYLLALTGLRALGWITPLGGLALLAGWGLSLRAFWRLPAHESPPADR